MKLKLIIFWEADRRYFSYTTAFCAPRHDIFFNPDLAVEFRQGDSNAKGLELSLQKKQGKFTGFASYTLSKVMRKVPGKDWCDVYEILLDTPTEMKWSEFNFSEYCSGMGCI